MNRVKVLDKESVDKRQNVVEKTIVHPLFNDPHLPATAFVGNYHLICSKDKRLYSTHFMVPVFYTSKRHRSLLYK